jgi:hypothetical protein
MRFPPLSRVLRYDRDPHGPFGVMELLMEAVAAVLIAGTLACPRLLAWPVTVLLVGTGVMAAMLFMTTVWMTAEASYALNVLVFGFYSFQYAVASAIIAAALRNKRYAFVFTWNTFLALVLAAILQVVTLEARIPCLSSPVF